MKKWNEFLNENATEPMVRKGDKVKVTMTYFQGKPTYEVEAYDNSWIHENQEIFSYLQGGDMMMIAKYDGEKWIS